MRIALDNRHAVRRPRTYLLFRRHRALQTNLRAEIDRLRDDVGAFERALTERAIAGQR